ncbi:MAG: B-box zinc finger protein [Candidatus Lokiarchaeota archaeon]|nr:B-box zinc finger protein [Candidatus Lokiarchaeota archaeon]
MSDQHVQICRFCQRNVKLAYYCEKCGISCCSDCLHEEKIKTFICQECDSTNISISESGDKICEDCGAQRIVQKSQLLKSCPKCHSNQIINIYEKKEDLEKSFLDLIKNSRFFIAPLRDLLSSLYQLKQKVIDARAPPIRCFHYPTMELDLLALFKLFIYAKENLIEKIRNFIQHLSLNKEYFFDIYTQQNSNIKIIEDILENLTRSYNSINYFIDNNVKTISTSIETLSKNLNFIDKITFYFINYLKFLNLAEKEKPVYAIYAKLSNGLNTQDKYKKNKGILFITNFDLSFVHEHGKRKKKQEGIFKAPVKDLTKVQIRGKVFKKLYIEFPYGRYEFSLPPNSISRVLDYIMLARSFDETIVYDKEAAKKLFNIEVDLSDLANFIEEAINSFFSLKCQYNNVKPNNGMAKYGQVPQAINQNPNYMPNIPPSQPLYNPYQNNNPNDPNFPYYANPNYKNIPENPLYYHRNIKNPGDLNYYYNNIPNNTPSVFNQNEFFLQSLIDNNRIQNYKPTSFNNSFGNPITNAEEKILLMRKLEQLQKYGKIFPNAPPNNSHIFDAMKNDPAYYEPIEKGRYMPQYHDFSKNHLSEFFNSDSISNYPNEGSKPYSKKHSKTRRKKMFDLEKEKYSLEETLKALDSKFESGNISEIDFFKNFKNLQKEIYIIEKNIEVLDDNTEDEEFLRNTSKEIDRKKYYT